MCIHEDESGRPSAEPSAGPVVSLLVGADGVPARRTETVIVRQDRLHALRHQPISVHNCNCSTCDEPTRDCRKASEVLATTTVAVLDALDPADSVGGGLAMHDPTDEGYSCSSGTATHDRSTEGTTLLGRLLYTHTRITTLPCFGAQAFALDEDVQVDLRTDALVPSLSVPATKMAELQARALAAFDPRCVLDPKEPPQLSETRPTLRDGVPGIVYVFQKSARWGCAPVVEVRDEALPTALDDATTAMEPWVWRRARALHAVGVSTPLSGQSAANARAAFLLTLPQTP